jgi:hypothetical protein
MSRRKLLPYNRPFIRPFRPLWGWLSCPDNKNRVYESPFLLDTSCEFSRLRSSLYTRTEMLYMTPALRVTDARRAIILDSLERSYNDVHGGVRQFSGYGYLGISGGSENLEYRSNHISRIFSDVDGEFANKVCGSVPFSFPIKRLLNMCYLHDNIWAVPKRNATKTESSDSSGGSAQSHGPFPYVDEKATVLSELTKSEILKTRHRVNSSSHPKWAIRTIRRRRRKMLIRLKRRSISQEAIRVLQAKLISSKST